MASIQIKDFRAGLDSRRLPEAIEAGFLLRANDCHVDRGGQLEQRAAFVPAYSLPAGRTVGLAADNNGLIVFGSGVAPALPAGLSYQQLVLSSSTLERILSWTLAAGKIYAAVRYDDASKAHFYDATQVAFWDGTPEPGDFVLTYNSKVYALTGSILYFSAVDTPDDWAGTGSGFVDMANQAPGLQHLNAVAPYQNSLAIFAPTTTLIYYVDPDPALNRKLQTLNNTGTEMGLSVTGFGDNDLFYAAASGVRSLQARDASNAAATTDTGVLIDSLVLEAIQALTDEQRSRVISLIEPRDGRFWLIVRDKIFVYSLFTGVKVNAWSVYNPGFVVDDACVFAGRVYLRSGDTVYVYGGLGAALEYDATEPEAWTAYLDAGRPTENKTWTGVDVACSGQWEVRAAMHPTNLLASDKVSMVDKTTYNLDTLPAQGASTHLSLRFKGVGAGRKVISSAVITYDGA